jgi:hypothetical protein
VAAHLEAKASPAHTEELRLILNVYTRVRHLKESKNWRIGAVAPVLADLTGIGRARVRRCVADFVDADLTIETTKPVATNAVTSELNESY